jgi:propionyl-CoA carboxylase alpha chain
MRIAFDNSEVAEGFARARSEAKSSFGDERVFIEKFITDPRHVEIQVLGDRHGNVIHLGERECSIQRRHQKIVEEAPSPAIDAKLRAEMGAQAVALAKAVGYDSAGTVEFVFGSAERRFYFLEMNTRLQVEHPVTELVTGIDLVEQMIRVAAGEKLALTQGDVRLKGWAVECRLYAEDPYRDFLPSIGRLNTYRPASEGTHDGKTVRIDSGVVEGSEVTIHFDPLIAKLVTHGPDRLAAIDTMADMLDKTVVEGLNHNAPFLSALMDHPRWRRGDLSTAFIAEEFPGGFAGIEPDGDFALWLAAVALSAELRRRPRFRSSAKPQTGQDDWIVRLGPREIALRVEPSGGHEALTLTVPHSGKTLMIESGWRPGDPIWSGAIDGTPFTVQLRPVAAGLRLLHRGIDVIARVMPPRVAELAALMPEKQQADSAKFLRCPMPGLVVAIHVAVGQEVRAGEAVAIVEAMKMENVLRAERDAVVKAVNAKPGDILPVDVVIVEFE